MPSRSSIASCTFLFALLIGNTVSAALPVASTATRGDQTPDGDGASTAAAAADESETGSETKDPTAQLLDLAFEAVSAMPLTPHIKNRSRAQEAVVATCLELGRLDTARTDIDRIDNWRQGAAQADYANALAEQGASLDEIQPWLDLARAHAESFTTDESEEQAWRRDRIRAKIARALHTAGQGGSAAEFELGLEDSEAGWLVETRAQVADITQVDAFLAATHAAAASGTYDQVRNALSTCAQLFNRFYEDEDVRQKTRDTVSREWTSVPIQIRIELLMELARFATAHDDDATALEIIDEAHALFAEQRWLTEHHVPLAARLAALRHEAGDTEGAAEAIEAERTRYETGYATIIDIFRAETLLPLAESYEAMGDHESALQMWALALEEGVHNPNSRPRAEDLAAICCSMARMGVAPDAGLWKRMTGVREALGPPW